MNEVNYFYFTQHLSRKVLDGRFSKLIAFANKI